MKTTIILLGARARVGKDTVAKMISDIRDTYGSGGTRCLSFAAKLREEVQEAFPQLDVYTQDPHLKETVVRPLLIAWGMARRHQDENYWVHRLTNSINPELSKVIVITDWRFPNELKEIEKIFASCPNIQILPVEVYRDGVPLASKDEEINSPLCNDLRKARILNLGDIQQLRVNVTRFLIKHSLIA